MKLFGTIVFALVLATQSAVSVAAPADEHADQQGGLKEALYSIPLATPQCPKLVREALANEPGVSATVPNLEAKTVRVRFDSSRTSTERIKQVIRAKAGFKAKLIKVTDA